MEAQHHLEFHCQECGEPVHFSLLECEPFSDIIPCPSCGKKYAFDDETLLRHMRQFEALCKQIHASEEILGNTAIAVDVGTHHVKVPFNILLTRLSSVIDLDINGKKLTLAFRVQPLKDVAPQLQSAPH